MTSLRELRTTLRSLPLTNLQLRMVMQAAAPLQPVDRRLFFAAVTALLRGHDEIGDGQLHQVHRQLQKEHLRAAPRLPEDGATFTLNWYDRQEMNNPPQMPTAGFQITN